MIYNMLTPEYCLNKELLSSPPIPTQKRGSKAEGSRASCWGKEMSQRLSGRTLSLLLPLLIARAALLTPSVHLQGGHN